MICSVLLKSFELRQQAICLRCINSFSVHSRSFKTRAAAAWIQCKSRSEDKLRPENKIRIKNSERRAEKMLLGVRVCSQDYTLLYLKDSFSPEGVDKQLHSRRITTVSVCWLWVHLFLCVQLQGYTVVGGTGHKAFHSSFSAPFMSHISQVSSSTPYLLSR